MNMVQQKKRFRKLPKREEPDYEKQKQEEDCSSVRAGKIIP